MWCHGDEERRPIYGNRIGDSPLITGMGYIGRLPNSSSLDPVAECGSFE
jgi:hypothetical protein